MWREGRLSTGHHAGYLIGLHTIRLPRVVTQPLSANLLRDYCSNALAARWVVIRISSRISPR